MRKYMWPNSCLPSATALITAAQTASHGRFTLEGVENHAARKRKNENNHFTQPKYSFQIIHARFGNGEEG